MTPEEAFGIALQLARTDRGWSQAKLAEAITKHPTIITKMEQGAVAIRLNDVFALADALRVPVEQLLGLDQPRTESRVRVAATKAALDELETVLAFVKKRIELERYDK